MTKIQSLEYLPFRCVPSWLETLYNYLLGASEEAKGAVLSGVDEDLE